MLKRLTETTSSTIYPWREVVKNHLLVQEPYIKQQHFYRKLKPQESMYSTEPVVEQFVFFAITSLLL